MAKEAICENCKETFMWTRKGKPPRHCDRCSERTEIDRENSRRKAATSRRQSQRLLPYKVTEEELDVMRAAVGLSMVPKDDVRALRLAGIQKTKAQAKKLCDQARLEYPDLCTGRMQGTAGITDRAIALMNIQLLQDVHLLSPRDVAGSLHQVVRFKELFTGEAKQTYGNITVNIGPPVPDRKVPEGEEGGDNVACTSAERQEGKE